MVRSPTRLACRRLPILVACALLPLAGCGGKEDDRFAPPCPTPSIPRDFGDVRRYRGAGLDITDAVLEGRIIAVNGSCTRDGGGIVKANVSVSMELRRGPAATGRNADVSYFVAVSEGERILDKRVYNLRAEFPANTDRLRLTGEDVELRLPVTGQKSAASYRISVGFQLTPNELAVNRSARPVR